MIKFNMAKRKYKNMWIAFLTKKELPTGELYGGVICYDKDRKNLHKKLKEKKAKFAYITFTGQLIKPGYEVMFGEI